MHHQASGTDSVALSRTTAFAMCDAMLRMSHSLILELPQTELRGIRYILDSLLTKADLALNLMQEDASLSFEGFSVDPDSRSIPGAEDFGAVLVLTTITTDPTQSIPIPSTRRRATTISCAAVPPMTTSPPSAPPSTPVLVRVPTPVPESFQDSTPPKTHGRYPLVLSSRDNVGFPDYTYHPNFVRPGIPGEYRKPPVPSGYVVTGSYHVVTKGLYVGIFTDWDESEPWFQGVSGSYCRKTKSWPDARDHYNSHLAVGTVRILS